MVINKQLISADMCNSHSENCQSTKVILAELVSGPLAIQSMKMASHLAGHLMIGLGALRIGRASSPNKTISYLM